MEQGRVRVLPTDCMITGALKLAIRLLTCHISLAPACHIHCMWGYNGKLLAIMAKLHIYKISKALSSGGAWPFKTRDFKRCKIKTILL